MLGIIVASTFLLLIAFTYLLIAHYVLALEVSEYEKKLPPDVELIDITTLQFPEEIEYDDEYYKPEYKK
jgi:hypothetical protein